MKKLLAVLAIIFSSTASAQDKVQSAYHQVERNVKIVITNQPCEKFVSSPELPLGFAYAINTDTADTVTGCFASEGTKIHIELTSEDGKSYYEYNYDARQFQPSENL
jgi:Na+-transporting NADH:ubiquinone oxidoreductase subunit NqrC